MAPPRKHDTSRILDAARHLALRDGPRAVSVAAIARQSGAPVGTLYHRFGSRDGVLAAAWLRALERFQERYLAAADHADPIEAGAAMAASVVAFARERPDDARLLLDVRRDDLLDGAPGSDLRARVDAMNAPLHAALSALSRMLHDRPDDRALDAVVRAVVDLPYAVVRRHARDAKALPTWLERDVATSARTLLQNVSRRAP